MTELTGREPVPDPLSAAPSRRLPALPLPDPDESLFSWVDACAAEQDVDRATMMRALGLNPGTMDAFRLAQATYHLTAAEAVNLTAATGLCRHDARRHRR